MLKTKIDWWLVIGLFQMGTINDTYVLIFKNEHKFASPPPPRAQFTSLTRSLAFFALSIICQSTLTISGRPNRVIPLGFCPFCFGAAAFFH